MIRPFSFVVRYRAAPQGSKDIQRGKRGKRGKPFLVESSKGVKPFRAALKRAATDQRTGYPLAKFVGPVVVSIVFEFEQARSNVDEYPTGQNIGDVDKLTRAALDGLTEAKVIEDDRYVVELERVIKVWGPEDRAVITVRSAADSPRIAESVVDFVWEGGSGEHPRSKARNPFEHPSGRSDHLLKCYDAECPGCYKAPTVKPWSEPTEPNPEAWDPLSGEEPPEGQHCCNPVDHKGCLMFGDEGTCPCPRHCTA